MARKRLDTTGQESDGRMREKLNAMLIELYDFVQGTIVNVTAATVTITKELHAGRVVTLNRAAGITATLPAATGSGDRYKFVVGTTFTGSGIIQVVGNDTMCGMAIVAQDGGDTVVVFEAGATADTITLDGTTTGGLKGADIELIDIAADTWWANVRTAATGTEATPFSAAV